MATADRQEDGLEQERPAAKAIAAYMLRMGEKQQTMREAADELGYSVSYLSEVMRGAHDGHEGHVARTMQRVMRLEQLRQRRGDPDHYVETVPASRAVAALCMARVEEMIVVVIGPPGVGKTTAVEHYMTQAPDALVTRGSPGSTPRAFLSGLLTYSGTVRDLIQVLTDRLGRSRKLLLVDNADYLPEATLHCLQSVWDEARTGMAFLGTPAWLGRLRRRDSGTVRQFLDRVGHVE